MLVRNYVSVSQMDNARPSKPKNRGSNPLRDANLLADIVLNRAIEYNNRKGES